MNPAKASLEAQPDKTAPRKRATSFARPLSDFPFRLWASLLAALILCPTARARRLEVTYTANEGVLLACGDKKVLVDGLFRPYKNYAVLPPEEREKAERAEGIFQDIDLILVTHLHRDHFHPQAVAGHLRANPSAELLGPSQVLSEIEDPDLETRMHSVFPGFGQSRRIERRGIAVRVLGLRHANQRFKWIENAGYLVRLCGQSILHIGDAAMDAGNFAPFDLSSETIEAGLIPAWFLIYGQGPGIVREQLRPKRIYGCHILPERSEQDARRIRENFPDATPFTRPLTSH